MVLYDYQQRTVDKALNYFKENLDKPAQFNLFFEMGLGKTLTSITILDELCTQQTIQNIVIVCPKSLLSMWAYELHRHFKNRYTVISDPIFFDTPTLDKKVFIVNYEWFRNKSNKIKSDFVILDEVHKVKNPKSLTHKKLHKLLKAKFRLNLTGTPITNTLGDIFGIHTALHEYECMNYLSTSFKKRFVDNVGVTSKQILMDYLKPFTVFANLEDHIDMPGYEHRILPLELTAEDQAELYKIATSNNSILSRITASQVFLSDKSAKRQVLDDLIKDIIVEGEKVVIFCKFDKEFNYLMSKYEDICVGINGKVVDRDTPVYEFQNNKNSKVFVGNLQTAGVGITLTAAKYCVFYSQTLDWKDFEQSCARIYRIGQKQPCVYYHILYKDSIDTWMYENNINKGDLIAYFKKLYGE